MTASDERSQTLLRKWSAVLRRDPPPSGPFFADDLDIAADRLDELEREVARLREALRTIAGEQNVYRRDGNFDTLPALDADEAQACARAALSETSRED